jgi:hypothetical protein
LDAIGGTARQIINEDQRVFAVATAPSRDTTSCVSASMAVHVQVRFRHSLKSFGIRLSEVGRAAFDQAVRAAVADDPLSAELMDAMMTAREAL